MVEPASRCRVRSFIREAVRLGGIAALMSGPTGASVITDTGQGAVLLPPGVEGASQISDGSHTGGTSYLLVSDDSSMGPRAYTATIVIDAVMGTVVGTPGVDATIALAAGSDLEGLALGDAGDFFASDEVGPAVRRYDAAGALVGTVTIPDVYITGLRGNLGLESLSRGPDLDLWTANEEALTTDGPISSFTEGTIVRLQRFDATLIPTGQWGYVTEAIPGDILGSTPGRDIERSGVVELTVLPNGAVLVLERAFGGDPSAGFLPVFHSRIYEIDFTGATETSAMESLTLGGFTPVTKTLLWERRFGFLDSGLPNYEGLALGPALDDGDLSIVLLSDDNGGSSEQSVYALRVTPTVVSVPATPVDPGAKRLLAFPNPVANRVLFQHRGAVVGDVLDIYDVAGARVASMRFRVAGSVEWNRGGAMAGVYFARLRRPHSTDAVRIILTR